LTNLDQMGLEQSKAPNGLMPRGGKQNHSALAARVSYVTVAVLWLAVALPAAPAADKKGSNDWSELSLEQLVNIEIRSPASLTEMDPRRVPVAMTQLDAQDVQQSGARNLNQLLEIYVPNAQFLLHHVGNRPAGTSLEEWTCGRQIRNQQYTGALSFKKELSPAWKLELLQSSDFWQFKDERAGTSPRPTRTGNELQAFSRAIGVWIPNDAHSLAFGVEYSHFWFGDPPQSDALDATRVEAKEKSHE
jgi:hypothetical protein